MPRFVPLIVVAILAPSSVLAQPNTLSFQTGHSFLGDGDHVGANYALAYERTLTPLFSASVRGEIFVSRNRDRALLIEASGAWRDRRHASFSTLMHLTPLRFATGSVQHRSSLHAGPMLRWRDDETFSGTFYPEYFRLAGIEVADSIAAEWAPFGNAYRFELEGIDQPIPLYRNGTYLSLTYEESQWDVGGILGLSHTLSLGRVALSVGAEHQHFLTESETLAGTARLIAWRYHVGVGYAF